MSVLGDAACQEDGQRHYAGGVKCHEDHVRTRFRDYADGSGQENHQYGVVTDPMCDVEMLEGDSEDQKHSECPCEDDRKMLLYDMVPQMLFNEMV